MKRIIVTGMTTLLVVSSLLFAACGGGGEPEAPAATTPEATTPPAEPTITRWTSTPTEEPAVVDLEEFEAAVLGAAPSYAAIEAADEKWAAAEEEFRRLFGEELDQYAVLEFEGTGTITVEMAGLTGDEPVAHRDYISTLQQGGGREYADSFLAALAEDGIAVAAKEELAEAGGLGEGGWGFTAQLEGGGLGVSSADGTGPDELIEFEDQPVSIVFFFRSNLMFKLTALLDPGVDALGIARALDQSAVDGSDA